MEILGVYASESTEGEAPAVVDSAGQVLMSYRSGLLFLTVGAS
jgi:hypothetical protein